jgi:arginase
MDTLLQSNAAQTGPAMPRHAIIEAPSILGLRPSGVEMLPESLLQAGLLERLDARRAGRVTPDSAYDATRDASTLTLNARGIAAYSQKLAGAVASVLDRGDFPIVLGGDCSILLGNLLALKRRGRYGLLFVDGHADFYQPQANPNGEAASMDLAFATGRGPDVLTNIDGQGPLARDADVVAFGWRDGDEQAAYGSQPLPSELLSFDLSAIRGRGIEAAAQEAVSHLTRNGGPCGFWIHVDADVLDDAVMPAVDYRLPGGLSWDELARTLRIGIESGRAVGLDLTIYNPKLDVQGSGAAGIVEVIGHALA